ncbi:hypothetical protein DENIS_1346 [Desulfonema ishimotonii]|uniref:Uncharacterized protein n=1 Tax=Desulfonema ishimotonii TaxID=45657 RepID=A0A401FTW5_9BACT|nr:hypothetical protein DENIS_1346 [Desulfonema ishimotonii]
MRVGRTAFSYRWLIRRRRVERKGERIHEKNASEEGRSCPDMGDGAADGGVIVQISPNAVVMIILVNLLLLGLVLDAISISYLIRDAEKTNVPQ